MISVVASLLLTLRGFLRSRAALHVELLALRHQLSVLERLRRRRLRLRHADRLLWVSISRLWTQRRTALVIVKRETVIAWHRRGFRVFWTWKSRRRHGRLTVPPGRPHPDFAPRRKPIRGGVRRGSMANC
jgi:putative transposase